MSIRQWAGHKYQPSGRLSQLWVCNFTAQQITKRHFNLRNYFSQGQWHHERRQNCISLGGSALDLDIYRVPTIKRLAVSDYTDLHSSPAKRSDKFHNNNNPWFHCAWITVFSERKSHMFGRYLCNKEIARAVYPWTSIIAQSNLATHMYVPWK